MSVLDTMRSATALSRRVTLCLDGALQDEYDRLVAALTDAAIADKESLAREHTSYVAEQMEAVREKMQAAEVSFTFGALPWLRRLALTGEHPPRDGNIGDKNSGYNIETYIPALIREACTSVTGADGDTITDIPDDVWDAMLASLNFQQVDTLFSAAQSANDSATTVPMSARGLLSTPVSDASLGSRKTGTSARAGSQAGNRPSRRKSSTTSKAESSAT